MRVLYFFSHAVSWSPYRISILFSTVLVLFFFKQKTAYEMRISDWSSDVCSSDLLTAHISDFRDEEVEHRRTAIAHRAEQAPAYPLLSAVVRLGCRTAIAISRRI